jgi:deoxyribonuclease V
LPKDIPHPWNLTPAEAIALQRALAPQVDTHTPIDLVRLKTIAGVDVSVKNGISRAAIVILTFPDFDPVETVFAEIPTPFPYIPGLLSFREGKVILEAHAQLTREPDAYIFDGQGIAHPRRLGIASHLGLWFDAPTIGCGKTWFVGEFEKLAPSRGSTAWMRDRGEIIGAAVRTRDNVAPVYISPGHRATVETAVKLALRCVTRYRLPEPIRAAHHAAGQQQTSTPARPASTE